MKNKILALLFTVGINTAAAQEIIPNEFDRVVVVYTEDGKIIRDNFDAPRVSNQKRFSATTFKLSPRDASRLLANIPTYGLALWHHWLFGEVILRNAQIEYAICIGEIRAEQRRLRIAPLIDAEGSVLKPVVDSVLGYHVPFLAVQNGSDSDLPPKKEDAIVHTQAAIDTVNVTVANVVACGVYRDSLIRRKR